MNQTIRQKIEQLFELPAMKMPLGLYFAQLNEAGKITAKSMLDILVIILETTEELEKKEEMVEEVEIPTKKLTAIRPTIEDIAGDGRDGDLEIKEAEAKIPKSIKETPKTEVKPQDRR